MNEEEVERYFELFYALRDLDITKILEQMNHPIDVRCPLSGRTILHYAAKKNDPDKVKLILAHGVDPNVIDNVCWTPIMYIQWRERRSCEVLQLLLDAGAKWKWEDDIRLTNVYTIQIFKSVSKETMEVFLKHGLILNARDHQGGTVLHYLAHNDNEYLPELLRSIDFDVNTRTSDGVFLLHFAVAWNNVEYVRFLLGRGANVNCETNEGRTPLSLAVNRTSGRDWKYNEKVIIVGLLVKNGAHINQLLSDRSIVEKVIARDVREVLEPVLERLAILEAEGVSIQSWYEDIRNDAKLNNYYDECKQEIERMRILKVKEDVLFFNILAEGVNKVSTYLRDQDAVDFFRSSDVDVEFPRYAESLRMKFEKAMERRQLVELQETAARILCESLQLFDPNHVVIDKIISYLAIEDLRRLS